MISLLVAAIAGASLGAASSAQVDQDPLAANDVVWTTPSRDEHGSMPIGNGDLAANVWVDESGTLSLYLAKSDAWDDNARLLKLGRIRLALDPAPSMRTSFVQRLDLREGEIEIDMVGATTTSMRVRVDAESPAVVIEIETSAPSRLEATLDHWRTARRTIKEVTWSDVFCVDWGAPPFLPMVTEPDRFLPPRVDGDHGELLWYHRNERSPWPMTMLLQGLTSAMASFEDPILFHTFGAAMRGAGMAPSGERSLRSTEPRRKHRLVVAARTESNPAVDAFAERLSNDAFRAASLAPAASLAAHRRWWDAFWDRSWVRIRENSTSRPYRLAVNDLPVVIGSDSDGGNAFVGDLETVLVYDRTLGSDEIAAANLGRLPPDPALVWKKGDTTRIPTSKRLDGEAGTTVLAWIVPGTQAPGGGRIADKAPVGTSRGWVLDTYPGNSLRFIAGDPPVTFDAKLEPGRRVFVAGSYDARDGVRRLFIDGEPRAQSEPMQSAARLVERGWTLQRYITACAGRGGAPIKFNGSLFTVPRAGFDDGDPDYRRWGPGYWFQNTRLIYWPLFATGDLDLMEPFFAMYRNALPLVVERSRLVEGDRVRPGGGAFHETIYFWGTPDNPTFGWVRNGAPAGAVLNPYIRHYRSGSIELLLMALERHAYVPDDAFLRSTILPFADAFLAFYDSFFPRDDAGRLRIEPAASLETWHDATNPLPEIAGLHDVLARLFELDADVVGAERIARWTSLRAALPAVPMRATDAGPVLAPAERYAQRANVENPELYAIFPYRLFGVGRPELEIARRTFAARTNRANVGWCQDSMHAAWLGLADEAASMVARRAGQHDQKSRFPAFWGPNYDWVPDQDHGSNIVSTVNTMLVQPVGDRIYVLPAWPSGWDGEFRLHAPKNTVLEGSIRDGRVLTLRVTPPERAADVVFARPE